MATIQIRDVDESTHRVLRTRAAAAGMSLQAYLRRLLDSQAARSPVEEVMARLEAETGSTVGMADVLDVLRADRDRPVRP